MEVCSTALKQELESPPNICQPEFDEYEGCEAGKDVTEEEYWKIYYEHPQFRYEYRNGKLEVKELATMRSYRIYKNLTYLMSHYFENNQIGFFIGIHFGFRLPLSHDNISIRKPDLAVILDSNPIRMEDNEISYKGTFDLCIEIVSDSAKEIVESYTKVKFKEYEEIGVKEYFIIDSNKTHNQFYKLDKNGLYSEIAPIDGVIESEVLPSFHF